MQTVCKLDRYYQYLIKTIWNTWDESWFPTSGFTSYFGRILRKCDYFLTKLKSHWCYRSHFLDLIAPYKILHNHIIRFAEWKVTQNYEVTFWRGRIMKLLGQLQLYMIMKLNSTQSHMHATCLSMQYRHFDTKKPKVPWPQDSVLEHSELRTLLRIPAISTSVIKERQD